MSEEAVNTIRDYLTKIELNFSYEEKEKKFTLTYDFLGREVIVNIFISDNWVCVGTLLTKAEDLPANLNKEVFYARLLQDTFYLNEVTFGLTKNNDVVVHAETHMSALSFKNFKMEYGSAIYGIKHFVENIMHDFPVKPSEAARLYV